MSTIVITAVLSALFTVVLIILVGWYLFQSQLRSKIDRAIDERMETAGEMIEERVRNGVVSAVDEVTSVGSMHRKVVKSQDRLLNALFGIREEE